MANEQLRHRVTATLAGVRLALLAGLALAALAIAPATADAFIYWGNSDPSRPLAQYGFHAEIGRANNDGTGVEQTFIDGIYGYPADVAVDGSHLFYGRYGPTGDYSQIGRANLDGSDAQDIFINSDMRSLALDSSYVYWTGAFRSSSWIGRATLDNPSDRVINWIQFTGSNAPPDTFYGPEAITASPSYLYWSLLYSHENDNTAKYSKIARASIDGSGLNDHLVGPLEGRITDVATDDVYIYWANTTTNTIGRASLDGSGANNSFISGGDETRDVAVGASHVYWTNRCCIGRANLDGTAVNSALITRSSPLTGGGIAVDSGSRDVTPPETTIQGGPSGSTNYPSPSFSFTSTEANSNFGCKLDSGTFSSCSSPKAYTDLADGAHSFQVRSVDVAGNADPTPAHREFTVDTTPPPLLIESGPSRPTNDANPTFSFAAEAGAKVRCSVDQGTAGFGTCSGSSSHTATTLADGRWTFRVRAQDVAGNGATASRTFTVDTRAPEVSISKHPGSSIKTPKRRVNVTFSFTSEPGVGFQCKLDSATYAACSSPRGYRVKTGRHTFSVLATDAAQNTGPAGTFSFKVKRVPGVSGSVGGGPSVSLPFLSQTRVEKAAGIRAAELCAKNSRCTGSSAQCDERLARNAFNCYINTYFPGPLGPRGKNCYFINLWALKDHPPRLTHRRYEKGSYPGGPYGMACESGPD